MSVANTLTSMGSAPPSSASERVIASEYASSPVAQPADQTRSGRPCRRASTTSCGRMSSRRWSKTLGSRKNSVTLMRRLLMSLAYSSGSFSSNRA